MKICFVNFKMMVGGLLCCIAANTFAADYVFSFAPNDERFDLERANNRTSLIAMRSLLQNFHGVTGFHFVLVGYDTAAQCSAELHCDKHPLLQRRIEAIIGDQTIQSFVADLQWRAASTAVNSVNHNEVKLMIETTDAPELSPQCPYQLEIADPQLPPVLPTSAQNNTWVDINKLSVIHVSEAASMRLRSNDSSPVLLSARQLFGNVNRDLSSGRAEIQWAASQLFWSEGIASVEIVVEPALQDATPQSRDIGDMLRPSLVAAVPEAASTAESNSCRIHFALSN